MSTTENTPTQSEDLTFVRAELDRLVKRTSVCPVIIANADTLRMVSSTHPDSRFYLWECIETSPVQDALETIARLNKMLNPDGRPETVTVPIDVLNTPMQKLKSTLNRLHTIKGFATVLMMAIAHNDELGDYGEVADFISDELGSIAADLDALLTEIGHEMT